MARWVLVLALVGAWWEPAEPVEPPRCTAAGRCAAAGSGPSEHNYIVDGLTVFLEYTDSRYFKIICPKGLTLDNSALPSFESQLRVSQVYFTDCPSPQSSYAEVLERLNVVVLDKLSLTNVSNLTAAHFAQLQHVLALELYKAALAPRALAALPQLQRLHLDSVRVAPGELRHLPHSLEKLDLVRMGTNVTAADLAALPHLAKLVVIDGPNVRVEMGPELRVLSLDMLDVVLPRELGPKLLNLTVLGWAELRPAPWLQCALESLDARFVKVEVLPAGWLQRCAALRSLRVEMAELPLRLEPGALRGAAKLEEIRLMSTALQYLPPGLLDDAPELKLLDLRHNRLLELPGGLFAKTNKLETLNLSSNQFTHSVLSSLTAVTSLVTLDVSRNDLHDSCGNKTDVIRGSSPLQYLTKLRELRLSKTNSSMICRDWRENMPHLKTLDLTYNSFEYITFADMQFNGIVDVTVDLQGNNISTLEYTRDNYEYAVNVVDAASPRAQLKLPATLRCDCHDYWAARAFHERPTHVAAEPRCAGGGKLGRAPDALECAGAPTGVTCGAPCACAWRPGPRPVLRVRCAGAGLRSVRAAVAAVRAPRGPPVDWELYLADNRIDRVDLDDLPHNLTVLDLRNNSVSSLSATTASELVKHGLRLADNPLACDCGAADTLAVLRAGLQDAAAARCAAGGALLQARPAPCARWPAPALGAAAALATLLACGALLAAAWRQPGLRLRLKAALHRRGWLPAQPEPEDDARRFDVFVSFSHGDERFVRQLAARLESGPAPYRLCLHYRDWAPGGWIPAQIAASVRASRRTVAVVSEHFLRSSWARAEFQEAHALALRDARPRLVVVLLDDPARLPLDDRLRRYLATNTYVRWGDPWFWEKLYLALPRGRGPAPPRPRPRPPRWRRARRPRWTSRLPRWTARTPR
ncbi:protein toll [Spodoptera frugiperda]|uniref:Protein toll n=1 Tax=Spodoptera frugiperda TaxID=7108 RepID=A0A9R0F7I1_SPOFR|nr:protein toll [Spodoptera frugiperda]